MVVIDECHRGTRTGMGRRGRFAGSGPAALREFHRVLQPGGLVAVATMSARHTLLQRVSDNRWKPQHNPSQAEMRALFEKRRVRRQRPAPCPATGVDSDRVRPDHRRHQELRVWAITSPRRASTPCAAALEAFGGLAA